MSRNRFNRHVFWWTEEAQRVEQSILTPEKSKIVTVEEVNDKAKELLAKKQENYPEIDNGEETVEGIYDDIKRYYYFDLTNDLLCDIAIEVSEDEKSIEEGFEVLSDNESISEEANEEENQEIIQKEKIKKHWYNNGEENILAEECPEGYVLGKLKKKKE